MDENMQGKEMEVQKQSGEKPGLSIASMVCGIVSLVVCCFSGFAVVLAIVAVVLGGVAIKKKCALKGMAIAGLVCGIITIAIWIPVWLIYGGLVGLSALG